MGACCRPWVALCLALALALVVRGADRPSLFSPNVFHNATGDAWWVVPKEKLPLVAVSAGQYNALMTVGAHALGVQMANDLLAGRTTTMLWSLAYLINSNFTATGACPAPPTDRFTQTLSSAMLIAGENDTMAQLSGPASAAGGATKHTLNINDVADALVGALYLAARSCGPPNALSSATPADAQAKYLTSTCYFTGPLLGPLMTMNGTNFVPVYKADLALATQTDPGGAGALLAAFQQCAQGAPNTFKPPSWLAAAAKPPASSAGVTPLSPTSLGFAPTERFRGYGG